MAGIPLTIEELIDRATNETNCGSNDQEALAVANQVNREFGGSSTAVKLLITKIQLRQEIITLQALNVIECCVKNCGIKFHNEIGKYKFINELIKMLSPKYDAEITPQSVKDRIVQLMFSWYCGLPEEKKIAEAYKMLKQQGIIKRDPVNPINQPKPREKQDTVFEEEGNSELLSTLLSSNNPDDLQSANKLIKTMVKQEEDRLERVSKRIQELETVNNNVKLLDEMLENFDAGSSNHEAMNDLYDSCLKMRPDLFKLASQSAEDKDDAMGEILNASDELTRVIDLYKEKVLLQKIIKTDKPYNLKTNVADNSALLDFGFDDFTSTTNNTESNQPIQQQQQQQQLQGGDSNSLLDEQLKMLGLDSDISNQVSSAASTNQMPSMQFPQSNLQMQSNFNPNQPQMQFSTHQGQQQPLYVQQQPMVHGQMQQYMQPNVYPQQPQQNIFPQNPVNINRSLHNGITPSQTSNILSQASTTPNSMRKQDSVTPQKKDLLDFDVFSEFRAPDLVNKKDNSKKDFKDEFNSNNKKVTENVDGVSSTTEDSASLLDISDISTIPSPAVSLSATNTNTGSIFSSQPFQPQSSGSNDIFATRPPEPQQPTSRNTDLLGVQTNQSPPMENLQAKVVSPPQVNIGNATVSQENYFVPLEALKPAEGGAPITVLDVSNLKTFLIVADDTRQEANQNVTVFILSTISTNASPVNDFSIQVAVPKVMRVKLQPATSDKFPAFNPILPPPSVTQVMLIANPSKEVIRLRFRISFQINGQTFVENSSVNNLPAR